MAEVEELRAHLIERYGFRAQTVFRLEDEVMLVRSVDGVAWVARSFGPDRPRAVVEGDAAILAWLEDRDFPAERLIGPESVSTLDAETVLLTRAVHTVPRARRRETIKDAGGIRGLGALLGRLHTLALAGDAVARPGGAWHHMSDGPPSAELAVAAAWLAQARERAGVRELRHFAVLEDAMESVDGCAGLPAALIHPDFVLANVVAREGPAMVLVDWAGAGTGPRLWSLAFLLWAEGAKNLRRVDLAMEGYRRHVRLLAEEVQRLRDVVYARALVFNIWQLHHAGRAAADAAAAVQHARGLAVTVADRVQVLNDG